MKERKVMNSSLETLKIGMIGTVSSMIKKCRLRWFKHVETKDGNE